MILKEVTINAIWQAFLAALDLILNADPQLLEVITLTVRVSGSALFLSCLVGIPLGVFLGLADFRGKRALQIVIYTGMGLPPVVVGLVIYLMFSRSGPFGNLGWLFTPTAMILAQAVLALPLAAGLTSTAVGEVSPEFVLQIRSLGTTLRQERWTIIKEARQGILTGAMAALGRIIAEVGAAMLVGGNIAARTRVLSTAIVLETRQGNFDLALALGFILLGIAFISNAITLRLGLRWSG